jgi:hypothetical protein
MQTKKYFIYTLNDPMTNEIRYVGKTNNPNDRYKRHLQKCYLEKYDKNTYKSNWIKSLLLIGENPIMKIIQECSKMDVNELEIFWIDKLKKEGCKLTNLSIGGEIGVDWIGKKHSIETKEKMKLSKNKYKKPVTQYDLNGNIMNEYESLIVASEKSNCHIYLISNCCNKKSYYTVSNTTFRYKDDEFDYIPYNKNIQINSRKICKYDLSGKLLETYDSIRNAALENNTNKSNISSCCKRKINKKMSNFINVKGFTWRYFDDTFGENL